MASHSQQAQDFASSQIFPESIQVLAIDANPVCLRIHRALLEKCKYKVITIADTKEALHLLRQPENKIDLVLSHVVRHDNMDGLELMETISSSKMDVPVVLVSARDDMDYIMRGLRHGASDYLIKPVRLADIKKLWYHVFKKMTAGTPAGNPCIPKNIIIIKEEEEDMPNSKRVRCEDLKKEESEITITSNRGASSSNSKRRISWTADLHAKFLDAMNKLGTKNKIYPLNILEQMNVPGLTRQNIASHLQVSYFLHSSNPYAILRENLRKSENENTKAEENDVLTEDEEKTIQLVARSNPKPVESISAAKTTSNRQIQRLQQQALPPSQHMPVLQTPMQTSQQHMGTVASIQPSHIICQGQTVHDHQMKQNLDSASTFDVLNNPIVQQALSQQDFGYGANNPSYLSFQQSDSQSYFPNYPNSSPNSFGFASHLVEAATSSKLGVFSQHALATMPPLQNFPLSSQYGGQHAMDFVQSGGDSIIRRNLIDCTSNMQVTGAAPSYMPENDEARLEQFNQEKFCSNGDLLCRKNFSDSILNERAGLNGSLPHPKSFPDSELNELIWQFNGCATPQLP
ncbi:hypothetical protein L6164_005896 [Bauhinia variegata]|uniref:Uncharacterized protein n=1 Tax=Bauhinia variegata TaxID=167791 RepID=A0ACB9PS73_BAUVA|nr:hypothetical protein L6164_005896 [Bauhinia variegata]